MRIHLRIVCMVAFVAAPFLGKGQDVAIKTNALYWGTTTPNLSVETALGIKTTLDVQGTYNMFTFRDNKKIKHWSVQPELRLWTCEKFSGGFFGFHAHYGQYNLGGIDLPLKVLPGLKDHRYEGYAVGAGFSYGYQWFLGNHWNLEAQFGFGYTHFNYDQYECHKCGSFLGKGRKHYFGPTKVGVSVVYLFKSAK